jgi:hypothetical protein
MQEMGINLISKPINKVVFILLIKINLNRFLVLIRVKPTSITPTIYESDANDEWHELTDL